MWKTIILCASLFGVAALGLVAAARFVEPAALPVAAAIGLCLVGVVLILIAPGREVAPQLQSMLRPAFPQARLDTIDEDAVPTLSAAVTGPQPSLH
jgi:hypothetical protein